MRQYQEEYIANIERILKLMQHTALRGLSREETNRRLMARGAKVRELREKNTGILRESLIPILDNILTADQEDIDSLVEFTDVLMRSQLDAALRYYVCKALVSYARVKDKRNLLIKELYMTGMALFGLRSISGGRNDGQLCWKMQMVFGEAAGYIRVYDEIEDAETRGYIHRSMGNLALGIVGHGGKAAEKKLEVIRRSLQVLTDPSYHEKTPDLPWNTYIYKQHQERTTLMGELRGGEVTAKIVGEVMESAQYVYDRQMKNAKERGIPLEARWLQTYYAASYYCGVYALPELLHKLEELYAAVSFSDYSTNGMYGNIYLPAIYSVYASKDAELLQRKKPVILMMYRRITKYLKLVPLGENMDNLFFYIRAILDVYIEYPGENCFREYAESVIAYRQPETYVHSCRVAKLALLIFEYVLQEEPEQLTGIRGIESVEELRLRREETEKFLEECCILHDIGKLKLLELYEVPGRSWFAEEEEIHRFHPVFGYEMLKRCDSTKEFAPVVLGHHRWYDGQGGFPEEYHRETERDAVLTDIVSAADFIDKSCSSGGTYRNEVIRPEEMFERLQSFSGTRFSPCIVEAVLGKESEIEKIIDSPF
ncbi:MAG: HD domain-containing protein [Butyrivibrio sp.]|nr:HD domain-containing protein [Acetatifactor muris]MCM1559688.1 HD domain-containing protein [Butyrivibrio sp.]